MNEVLRTNDVVLLSFAASLLRDEGIEPAILDTHTSVLEGSIGAIPRRLMVADDDYPRARVLLDDALAAAENGDATPDEQG